jgi:hypothetical protein
VHPGCLSSSNDRAEVVGILDAVKEHEQRRLALLTGQLENSFSRVVRLGRDKGDDPLMVAAWRQAIEGSGRLDVDRNVSRLGQFHEISKLSIGSLHEKALKRTVAGTQGFAYRVQSIEEFRPVIASSGWCRQACLR